MGKAADILTAINWFIHPYKDEEGVDAFISCLTQHNNVDLGEQGTLTEISEEFHETSTEVGDLTMVVMVDEQLYKFGCFLNKEEGAQWVNASLTEMDKLEANVTIPDNYRSGDGVLLEKMRAAIDSYPVRDKFLNSPSTFVQDVSPDKARGTALITLESIGTVQFEAEKRGMENGGHDIWVVFSHDQHLYKLSGWYDSYGGSDYTKAILTEVVAKEQTVIYYEEIG